MARPSYPKTMREFRQQFNSPTACLEYLVQCRWPEGFVCPKCSEKKAWLNSRRYVFECSGCGRQTSPTAGTIMHRSRVPLQDWFSAAYHMATFTPGLSALQLQRQLGFRSHDTAWYLLHRLRKGMVNDARSNLSGLVEADETFIGGPEKGKRGRGAGNKSLVVRAIEVLVYYDKSGKRCERAGRLRLALIPDATEDSLGKFLNDHVMPKSRVRTDGWKGYSDAALEDYIHHVRIVGSAQLAHKRFPHIHRVFGNLKTWLNGTHHGVLPKYLPSYLDEFVFRFNRRGTADGSLSNIAGNLDPESPCAADRFAVTGVNRGSIN